MNQKYIVGAAVGFAVAWLLLNNKCIQCSGGSSIETDPRTKLPQSGGAIPRIGIRPWSQRLPLHA